MRTNPPVRDRGDEQRLVAWERRTDWPLILLSLAFLATYAWPILDPTLPSNIRRTCAAVSLVAWAAFAADYVVRMALAADRRAFIRRNIVDLATVVLPMLR